MIQAESSMALDSREYFWRDSTVYGRSVNIGNVTKIPGTILPPLPMDATDVIWLKLVKLILIRYMS